MKKGRPFAFRQVRGAGEHASKPYIRYGAGARAAGNEVIGETRESAEFPASLETDASECESPKGFLWGASTSAHQVEGNNVNNNWWNWEMRQPVKHRSGKAAAHYDYYKQDFSLAKKLKHNAQRISIEWSRIEPEPNKWDKRELDHYRQVLQTIRDLDMTPMVTLHHFTNPQWFSDKGGWLNANAPRLFARYAKVVLEHLGDLSELWVTINEPMVVSTLSYWHKRWPPQKRNLFQYTRVVKQMAAAHNKAYRLIHNISPQAKVGIAKHSISYIPTRNTWYNRLVANTADYWFNDRFFRLTKSKHDFIGVNYYFQNKIGLTIKPPFIYKESIGSQKSDIGWKISPSGLYDVLIKAKKHHLPVYVTENGLADKNDRIRPDFIRQHLRMVEKAQKEDVDVRGYFHWSLIDNFEWDIGFSPRFGLIEVDYDSMRRTPRPSAYVYRAIIESAQNDFPE